MLGNRGVFAIVTLYGPERPETGGIMRRWNKGIGAVTQRQRLGFSERDQRDALYECKAAQFAIQEGHCGVCYEFMDPIHAIWTCSRWMRGNSLAQWAFGQALEYNHETLGIDSHFRSPDEIRAEYDEGTRGHALFHRRCLAKWKRMAPGLHGNGPAYVRELELALSEGHDAIAADRMALERIHEQARAVMKDGRVDPKAKKDAWLSDVQGAQAKTPGKVRQTANYRTKRPKQASNGGERVEPRQFHRPTEAEKQVIRDAADAEMDTPFARYIEELGQKALRDAQEKAGVAP